MELKNGIRQKSLAAIMERQDFLVAQKKRWMRIALRLLLLALLAALACGKWMRPHFPRPPLLATPEKIASPEELSAATEALEKKNIVQAYRKHDRVPTRTPHDPSPNKNALACEIELRAKYQRLNPEAPLPICTKHLSSTRDCSQQKREFAEVIYLYAYAYSTDKPAVALKLLSPLPGMLANCAPSLPLRDRASELLRKLAKRTIPATN